jgi:hypothetical protein
MAVVFKASLMLRFHGGEWMFKRSGTVLLFHSYLIYPGRLKFLVALGSWTYLKDLEA